jgi:hypothetical protein
MSAEARLLFTEAIGGKSQLTHHGSGRAKVTCWFTTVACRRSVLPLCCLKFIVGTSQLNP